MALGDVYIKITLTGDVLTVSFKGRTMQRPVRRSTAGFLSRADQIG